MRSHAAQGREGEQLLGKKRPEEQGQGMQQLASPQLAETNGGEMLTTEGIGDGWKTLRAERIGALRSARDLAHADDSPRDTGGAAGSRDSLSPDVAMADDHHGDRDEGEEGRSPKAMSAPLRISREEREAHEMTHTPYRAWCPMCVKARGRNTPHKRRSEEQKKGDVPRISMDYFFMSTVDERASSNPILVMVDETTGEKYARAVGQKGLGQEGEMDWLVKDLAEELKTWGHTGGESGHILLKTDGERSITAVREALAKYHGGKVVPETPPRGESQSNGAVESAGKTVREYVRVLKETVEEHCAIKMEAADVLTTWAVRWAAMLCSRYLVGTDGMTPYERRRGRRCQVPTAVFGEKVWYKELRMNKDRANKLESEWAEGIWLGHARSSNEHIIGTTQGAVKAYAVKRQDPVRRWDRDLLQNLQGTPQRPDPNKPGIAIPIRVNFDAPAEDEPVPAQPEERHRQIRRMKLTGRILEKYGYSENCEGCRFKRAGLSESRNHTDECRKRIEGAMAQDEHDAQHIAEQEERIGHRIAEQIQRSVEKGAQGESDHANPPERPEASNIGAGDSNPRAEGAEQGGNAESGVPTAEPSRAAPMEDSTVGNGGEAESGLGGRGRDCSSTSDQRKDRSRSPRGGDAAMEPSPAPGSEEATVSTPENVGTKRDGSPKNEQTAKKAKPDDWGMDVELTMLSHTAGAKKTTQQSHVKGLKKLITVGAHTSVPPQPPEEEEEEEEEWRQAWDDVTGQPLDPAAVAAARAKELEYVHSKGVWRKIPRATARARGIKIVAARWIDINKGDIANPNYRSRYVAKEFNNGPADGLFAATPPLEAMRLLLSDAASSEGAIVMVNDVARAFFEAPVRRTVCVELPPEEESGEDMVGLLEMSLYGTRDAAANFQAEVRKFMLECGFQQSVYSPQIYHHKGHDVKALVHGDDFMSTSSRTGAQWFQKQLERRFEIKSVLIGTGPQEVPEGRVLGRIVRAMTDGSWEYEADPRHAELLIRDMKLEEAKGVSSPGEEERPWEIEDHGEPLNPTEARNYRAAAARANYLAQDRADLQYAAKEACRGMAAPTVAHYRKLKRLVRYLISAPRVVSKFAVQKPIKNVDAMSDSDWAGCRRTARSTSGGALMRGAHCLKTWSTTQKFVTLSSAEAELMALVKAASEAIGLAQLALGWGLQLDIGVHVDSSAALAVVSRKGNGKLRHVRIGHLWIQELAENEEVKFFKVKGTENPADLMTKYLSATKAAPLVQALGLQPRAGHASSRLAL